MSIDFTTLPRHIEQAIDEIAEEAQQVKALILTEDDLKCILYNKLRMIPILQSPYPTQDPHILGSAVHAEISWYGEINERGQRRLAIKPDITILEPEHLSILHGYIPSAGSIFHARPLSNDGMIPQLPRKDFEFGGRAITFELKFVRGLITNRTLALINADYRQMLRLFDILDQRGDGDTVFSYMVVFCKYQNFDRKQRLEELLYSFGNSYRHKVVYKNLNIER